MAGNPYDEVEEQLSGKAPLGQVDAADVKRSGYAPVADIRQARANLRRGQVPTTLDPKQSAAAPAAPVNPYDEVEEKVATEDEQRLAQVRDAFKEGLLEAPDRKAGVIRLSRKLGLPTSIVEQRYEEFGRAAEAAEFDPARWRRDNPEMAKLVDKYNHLGPVVMKDDKFAKGLYALNKFLNLGEDPVESLERRGRGEFTALERALAPIDKAISLLPGQHPEPYEKQLRDIKALKQRAETQVPAVQDEGAALSGLERLVGEKGKHIAQALGLPTKSKAGQELKSAPLVTEGAAQFRQVQHSNLGWELMWSRRFGDDTYELEKKKVDLERDLYPRSYGETSMLEGLALSSLQPAVQNVTSLPFAAAGAVEGAVAGALGGPGGIAAGARLGGSVGYVYSTLKSTTGAFYNQLEREKLPDGSPLPEDVRFGASLVEGALETAIEFGGLETALKSYGPLGDLLAHGEAKQVVKSLLREAGFRRLAVDVGKREGKQIAAEAMEEGSQNIVGQVLTFLAHRASGDDAAKLEIDTTSALSDAYQAGVATVLPAVGKAAAVLPMQHALERELVERSKNVVGGISALADTPTAQASPQATADAVEAATARQGAPVTSLYVDPQALRVFFQKDSALLQEAATTLMGEDGPRRMEEAIASGGKLEVPVAEWVEKWANRPDLLRGLEGNVADAPGRLTPNELAARDTEITDQAKALVEGSDGQLAAPQSPAEAAWLGEMEEQLVRTGKATDKQARTQMALWQGLARTMESRFGTPSADLFRDALVTVEREGKSPTATPALQRLNQGEDATRGYVLMSPRTRQSAQRLFKIVLTGEANRSTFLHESGHVFLELLGDMSEREAAPQQVKDDHQALLKYLGVEKRSDIQTEQHEKLARSFERYLMEGKAPSAALAGAFQRMKLWMLNIYKRLTALNAPLTDEVRGVFDRLLATDEEIARTKQAMGLRGPLFRSPEEAGMSASEWQAYLQLQEKATSAASLRTEARAAKDRLRETEGWWKEEKAQKLEDADREYEARPDVQAMRTIRGGDLRLDRAAVTEALGEHRAKAFNGVMRKKDAEHPDTVAEWFGFPTGKVMLEAVLAVPEKDALVKERAEAAMREAYPSVLEERAQLQKDVEEGLHGEWTESMLVREWAALRSKAGEGARHVEALARSAKLFVEKKLVRRLDVGAALRGERSSAEKAALAAAKGNYKQAFIHKQQQLLSFYIARELQQASEERDKFEDLAADLRKDKARARLGKADPLYRDGVDAILEALGMKEPEQREAPFAGVGAVVDAMQANAETVAFDIDGVAALLEGPKPWKELSVAEMRNVTAALKNIRQAARNRTTALVDGKRVEKEALILSLQAEAEANLPKLAPVSSSVPAMSLAQAAGSVKNSVDAWLLQMRTIIVDFLGGGDPNSEWGKAVFRPLQDAKKRSTELMQSVAKPIVQVLQNVPKEVKARWYEKVDGAALFPTHTNVIDAPTRRFELFMMALNRGNEGNLQRLLDGRGITVQQVDAAIALLSKEELDAAQAVIDGMEKLWPEIRALEERDSGLAPEKVQATPFQTPHGTYQGGYFPLVYEKRVSEVGQKQALSNLADLLDPSYTRPGTSHGFTKARVQKLDAIVALDPSIVPAHLAQAVHDIAYREALKSVGGIVMDPAVQTLLTERLGHERAEIFLEWLKDVGHAPGVAIASHANLATRLAGWLRTNSMHNALGYGLRIALGDESNFTIALTNTPLKAKYLLAGMNEVAGPRAFSSAMALATQKSGELNTRWDETQRHLTQETKRLSQRAIPGRRLWQWLQFHAFDVFEWTEKSTAVPIWIGAYRQAIDENRSEADAVAFADDIAQRILPAFNTVDKAKVSRDRGLLGGLLMFYSYANTTYQRNRELVHQFWNAAAEGDSVGQRWLARGVVSPRLAVKALSLWFGYAVLGDFLSGKGPEASDGEDPLERWARWTGRKMMLAPLYSLPYVSAIAETWVMGKTPSARSAPQFDQLIGTLGIFKQFLTKDEWERKDYEALARWLGTVTGAPGSQSIRTGGYLIDLLTGEREPGPLTTPAGVVYGERDGQGLNPGTAISEALSGEN